MSHELICSWLGLPGEAWPPNHYRLLGLDPGESDVALIEQRVHQRLETVRRYQMTNPEQATEAMNRLAQAYVCLTDTSAKRAYDLTLPIARSRPAPPPPPPVVKPQPRDPLVWLYTSEMDGPGAEVPPPPPVRVPPPPLPPPIPARAAVAEVAEAVEVLEVVPREEPLPPPPPAPPPEPVDPVLESARSAPVRRGIGTRRALYKRVARTRHLLRLWHRMGKHLADPEKRLGKQDAAELKKTIEQAEEAVEDFPLLGEAGQPGYLIISLTTLDRARDLRNLTPRERESLERDWQAGLRFLEGHRDFLRAELRAYRRCGFGARLVRAARSMLNEQPVCAALVLLALAAVVVAVWRSWLQS
jgi:hypothetical protein